jgi:hypothetical protein
MSKIFAGVISALVATTAMIAGAAPAGAITPTIHKPTLTAVCGQPHHGNVYTEVRFRQRGRGFAGSVVVTLSTASSDHPKVEMHTKTGPDGAFTLRRTLHSTNTGPWIAGATYSWTTAIYQKTAAMARRGTVTLTANC